ncbi:[protein-PII] uridylyltransferase [Aurantiacibacter gangjinensis]|uniref:Bifunctional uridylyltransferase/uridylyl-removing enzyme n=1 Tax=Aurantiacibacter gangjinensis TaxID=502682 RepID=A0A0G9MNJ6_9SPHN|nr:[protein-PII] uridylyltransferase [Aurantiacibacter gangjinensis]KLE32159.1 protein-PII uridylyltransferase [Aurantiacibacter gangjinensis]
MSLPTIPRQRAIISRRKVASAIDAVVAEKGATSARQEIVEILRGALDAGRAELTARLEEKPGAGHANAHGYAFLIDQLIRIIHDHVVEDIYPAANRTSGERLALLAVGGYGRGEMSPHSDVDIAFVTPDKPTSWCEQVIEAILYYLWDLGFTVGHSTRSLAEVTRMATADLTVRTALLEARFLWGDRDIYDEASARFWADVVPGTQSQFVAEKLEERDARHKRMGGSRYVVEPNVKDGKGGLRDLQTLYWIGKYLHRVRSARELIEKGLFTQKEYRSFRRAERFLLAVRAHLHTIAGRGEDRLTFDLQREVAARMNYADRPGKSAVERFMQFYFLQAKHVGQLSSMFLSHLEEETAERSRIGEFIANLKPTREVDGYPLVNGALGAPSDDWFQQDPARLLEIYAIAEREGLEVHPSASRIIRRDAGLIDAKLRKNTLANDLFLSVLAGRNDPETVLRWMNETGVFGRFVPDFGKVNAQMQFDMYHHYTVDEHTIRAIGLLSQIERGELADDHPLSTGMLPLIKNRRVLYASVLLHDIAKGRGGDHSVLGADVARRLCPRLGLDARETELVAWLVRYHLLMSATAFKRDLSDPKTIVDFVSEVQSLERLRLLTVLTVVDIRAVGPGIWNSWKRQLISDLYEAAVERLRLGHKARGREERVAAKKAQVADMLGDKGSLVEELADAFDDAYWIAEPEDVIAINLPHYAAAQDMDHSLSIHTEPYEELGATLVTVIADDHPGLFYRIAGAISLAGANIIDARIHTNRAGKGVDNFLVQDPMCQPFSEGQQLSRLRKSIEDALLGKIDMVPSLAKRPLKQTRAENFSIAPLIVFDNDASNRFTVIEVNATDRPALLNRLTRAMFEQSLIINSAHITHYGERAVDTFYVTDLLGDKIVRPEKLARIEQALLDAVAAGEPAAKAA